MELYLPHFDTLLAGRPTDGNMTGTNPYVTYSHPIAERVLLTGFHVNFSPGSVSCTLQNKTDKHVWSPFFHTNLSAVAGRFSNVEPVRRLPRIVEIAPFSRIQIVLVAEPGSSIEKALITLVGVRVLEREVLCFT